MDPVTLAALQNVLSVRARLLAHASAVWVASRAVDHALAALPPTGISSWRGPAAHAEAQRVQEVADALTAVRARLDALSRRIARDTMVVDLHVG